MVFPQSVRLKPAPAVFKRWSRKPYAILMSLHREVVIGVVKASICDASMLKMGIKTRCDYHAEPARHASPDDDDGPDPQSAAATAPAIGSQAFNPRHSTSREPGRGVPAARTAHKTTQ